MVPVRLSIPSSLRDEINYYGIDFFFLVPDARKSHLTYLHGTRFTDVLSVVSLFLCKRYVVYWVLCIIFKQFRWFSQNWFFNEFYLFFVTLYVLSKLKHFFFQRTELMKTWSRDIPKCEELASFNLGGKSLKSCKRTYEILSSQLR